LLAKSPVPTKSNFKHESLLNFFIEDVQPGDRYSLTYIPGNGTELALNVESKGFIEGADFAAAVFSIWLGPKPISDSFKQQILGR